MTAAEIHEHLDPDHRRDGLWVAQPDGSLRLVAWRGPEGWEPICEFCGGDATPVIATTGKDLETGREWPVLICQRCLKGDA